MTCVFVCLFVYVWDHKNTRFSFSLPVTPLYSREPCIPNTPAQQIISLPVTSAAASNSQWLFPNSDNLCLFERMWPLSMVILRVWVSRNFLSLRPSLVYRQTECRNKLSFNNLKYSMVFSAVSKGVAVWYNGPLHVLHLTASVFQTEDSGASFPL